MADKKSSTRAYPPLSHSLNFEDMWTLITKEDHDHPMGIISYQVPKYYFDHRKQITEREFQNLNRKVIAGKAHYPKPILPKDENGKDILPQKKNFIDDAIKLATSGYSKDKHERYLDFLKEKGLPVDFENPKKDSENRGKNNNAKIYNHDRHTYLEEIIINEKKKEVIPEEKEEMISKIKEQIKEDEQKLEKDALKRNKGGFSKSDRVSTLCDYEYLGEGVPFYNTKIEEEEDRKGEDEEKKNTPNFKDMKLFYPDKSPTWKSSPKYKFHKEGQYDKSYLERKEEDMKAKAEEIKKQWSDKRVNFIDNISVSFLNLHKPRGIIKWRIPYKEIKTDEVADRGEIRESRRRSPGPQEYWKTPVILSKGVKEKVSEDESSPVLEEIKKYFMERGVTDKRVCKPMKKYCF